MTRVALSRVLIDRVHAEAERHGHQVVATFTHHEEFRAMLLARPQVVLLEASSALFDEQTVRACDEAGIRLLIVAADPADRARAASLGVHEVVAVDSPWTVFDAYITGTPLGGGSRPTPVGGVMVAVWGPLGSPGRSTVAVTVAAELAEQGARVLLVDADTHAASVAPMLGLLDEAPGFAAACRLAGADSLTGDELDRLAQTVHTTAPFRVLTGIGRASRWPELSAERVTTTLEACRRWAEVVVVDVAAALESDDELLSDMAGPRRNAATITALAVADRIIAVGAAEPIGLSRFLRGYADLVETAVSRDVRVVMNRVRSSAVGSPASAHVNQALARFAGIRAPVLIPDDRPAFDAAVLVGRPITSVAPRSAARQALRQLARDVAPEFVRSSARPRSGRRVGGRRASG